MAVTLVRQRGERNRVWGKEKASICVCLPTALYIQHAAHELLVVNWQNEELAIKMLIFLTPHIILASKKKIKVTLKCCMAQ